MSTNRSNDEARDVGKSVAPPDQKDEAATAEAEVDENQLTRSDLDKICADLDLDPDKLDYSTELTPCTLADFPHKSNSPWLKHMPNLHKFPTMKEEWEEHSKMRAKPEVAEAYSKRRIENEGARLAEKIGDHLDDLDTHACKYGKSVDPEDIL